ncbi:hypothetical protein P153DRAFT_382745 [Dothidotthia symphoricarpi CBS 119687]|uniref:Uncharacterized protein n=1 Tax=Dothidotthia symphoricarpi CBS 119687 TaxID=1392245 RepID=A0A6A6AIR3_9PLEO|nr:uncharacterized protein P153DRAFT_382745 [Dothidotthia symphoricarpi CBS 119687]KAF2131852.1 hypothetical protein P153DRAFT_382745 [Dothidotthia symphoricarpi CBS 119687]
MSIFTSLLSFFLLFVHPDALKALLGFLLGNVVWTTAETLPGQWGHFVKFLACAFALGVYHWLAEPYKSWHETFREDQNQRQLIRASQVQVDPEARPLNFPRMPDMFDITYNPWTLP